MGETVPGRADEDVRRPTGSKPGSRAGSTVEARLRPDLAGREAASALRTVLTLTGAGALLMGVLLVAAARDGGSWFAWRPADPLTPALLAAGFLGAVPMLWHAATRLLWQQLRVPVLAVAVALAGMTAVSLTGLEAFATGGALVRMALTWVWLLGIGGLAVALLAGLAAQALEPGLPLARTAPLPRWTLPLLGLLGAAYAGLGAALLVAPGFWAPLLPWQTAGPDAPMTGTWALAIGLAVLAATAEDDLHRLRSGLVGITGIGALGLAAVAWQHGSVRWSGAPAALVLVMLVGLLAAGLVGLVLARTHRDRPRSQG